MNITTFIFFNKNFFNKNSIFILKYHYLYSSNPVSPTKNNNSLAKYG